MRHKRGDEVSRILARLAWRVHAARRRAAGGCCDCQEPALPGESRCATHKRKNLRRTRTWHEGHPDQHKTAWQERAARVAAGFCLCPEKRPLPPGQRRCDPCRATSRTRAAIARGTKPTNALHTPLQRAARTLQRGAEAEAQLRAMGYEPGTWGPSVKRIETPHAAG